MKKIFAFLLLTTLGLGAHAQLQGILKLSYENQDPNSIITSITDEVQNPNVDFLRKCNIGVGFRATFPLGIYLQVEGDMSLNAAWDSVANISTNFAETLGNAFAFTQNMSVTIPAYVGWKFFDVHLFAARVFAGPEFYTTSDFRSFDFHTFSLTAGAGIDLLNVCTIDGKVTYLMASKATAMERSQLMFGASLGFFF